VREGLKPPSCGLRERAEAEVLLTSDEITKSKHGIAVMYFFVQFARKYFSSLRAKRGNPARFWRLEVS